MQKNGPVALLFHTLVVSFVLAPLAGAVVLQRAEREGPRDVTFLVIQPRIVCMRYGCAEPRTADDIAFLKKLRASSLQALATIGVPSE